MNKTKKNIIIGTIICILVILLTVLSYYIHGYFNLTQKLSTDKLGHFGDFIGGFLGTLLTILATVLIYLTYNSQKQELSLNRVLLEQQQFENTFFNMLKVHQDIKANLSINTSNLIIKDYAQFLMEGRRVLTQPHDVKGRNFFIELSKDFERLYRHFPHDNPSYYVPKEIDKKLENNGFCIKLNASTYRDDIKEIKYKYDLFFENYASYLGDYFRNLYHILKFISTKKKTDLENINDSATKNKVIVKYKQYSDILQSQMNFSELQITFYNCFKFRKFRKLVKEFDFVENLHSSNLYSEEHLKYKSIGNIKSN